MQSENINENAGQTESPNPSSTTIPDSISIPTELDVSPQYNIETSTIISVNNTPKDNEDIPSSNEKKCCSNENYCQFQDSIDECFIGGFRPIDQNR